jgi:hypothetical protein
MIPLSFESGLDVLSPKHDDPAFASAWNSVVHIWPRNRPLNPYLHYVLVFFLPR